MTLSTQERRRGCLLGLACGDAVGTAVEFSSRGSFAPIIDMVGGGPFRLTPGAWTDDTSMALCLATSLVECHGVDATDQMERYCRWWHDGYLSSTDSCFDIGNTVSAALRRFEQTGDPNAGSTDPYSAGNGSIMRLAPVPIYYHQDLEACITRAAETSRTTHGADECLDACRLFAAQIWHALRGADKETILGAGTAPAPAPAPAVQTALRTPKIRDIAQGAYRTKTRDEIRGTGYVVQSLEAALWCFHTTDNFRDAILTATNLGDDADTTAAICGQVAGAHYGESGIPAGWLDKLVMRYEIRCLADLLGSAAS